MSELADLLRERIARDGPIPVADYMALALGHPGHGYYMTRDPLGAAGDFTTAPEISQMFGELLGLWCADTWQALGAPDPVHLVECGPGRGTLAADMLRAISALLPLRKALRLHLVETSPVLRTAQQDRLAGTDAQWHERLDGVPPGPMLLVANEFLDALPVRQHLRRGGAWHERLVGLAPDGRTLEFVPSPLPDPDPGIDPAVTAAAEEGDIAETSPAMRAVAAQAAAHIARDGGAALFIDYGYNRPAPGETLQAVRRHRPADILETPGETDLTAHVDFAAVADAARAAGAAVLGPVTQGEFLERLGIRVRAARLSERASEAQRGDIASALARLIDPREMGTLFKVLAVLPAGTGSAAGFAGPSAP